MPGPEAGGDIFGRNVPAKPPVAPEAVQAVENGVEQANMIRMLADLEDGRVTMAQLFKNNPDVIAFIGKNLQTRKPNKEYLINEEVVKIVKQGILDRIQNLAPQADEETVQKMKHFFADFTPADLKISQGDFFNAISFGVENRVMASVKKNGDFTFVVGAFAGIQIPE